MTGLGPNSEVEWPHLLDQSLGPDHQHVKVASTICSCLGLWDHHKFTKLQSQNSQMNGCPFLQGLFEACVAFLFSLSLSLKSVYG